jgi:hypothetical protein
VKEEEAANLLRRVTELKKNLIAESKTASPKLFNYDCPKPTAAPRCSPVNPDLASSKPNTDFM